MKLNKQRQQMYLDGKVCIHYQNDDLQLLCDICEDGYFGDSVYYWITESGRKECDKYKSPNLPIYPIAWFYEETEFPKKVRVDKATLGTEWYKDYIGTAFNVVRELNSDDYIVEHLGAKSNYLIAKSDCTPINETTPTSYKLNIDIPEWLLKAGDKIESGRLPRSIIEHIATPCTTITETTPTSYKLNIDIPEWDLKAGTIGIKHKIYDNYLMFDTSMLPISLLPYIATPCTTFTLENGTQIELTANDIDKIKKL